MTEEIRKLARELYESLGCRGGLSMAVIDIALDNAYAAGGADLKENVRAVVDPALKVLAENIPTGMDARRFAQMKRATITCGAIRELGRLVK